MSDLDIELGLEEEEVLEEEGEDRWESAGSEQLDQTRPSVGTPFTAPTPAPTKAGQPPPSPHKALPEAVAPPHPANPTPSASSPNGASDSDSDSWVAPWEEHVATPSQRERLPPAERPSMAPVHHTAATLATLAMPTDPSADDAARASGSEGGWHQASNKSEAEG